MGTREHGHRLVSVCEFAFERAPLRQHKGTAKYGKGHGVFEQLGERSNGARRDKVRDAAQWAPAGVFCACREDGHVGQSEGLGCGIEEPGALLQGFDEVDGGLGGEAGEDDARVASAAPDIDDDSWFVTGNLDCQAPRFKRFGVVPLDRITMGNTGDTGVRFGFDDEGLVRLKQGQPARGIAEHWEQSGQLIPFHAQGNPEGTFTGSMIHSEDDE